MKLVQRKDIDTKKWDAVIGASPVENIFQYSWYLDIVSPDWSALISENYKTILPVPFTKKLNVRQFYQAQFTREYTIIGADFNFQQAVEFLAAHFKAIHFRNGEKGIIKGGKKRTHQFINLETEFKENYSTNAKRILKKATDFKLESSTDVGVLIKIFKDHVAHKIETLSKKDVQVLEALMKKMISLKKGELLLVKKGNEIVAAGFFMFDKTRVTYLKGASSESAKKEGAMYFLLDQALKKYASRYSIFDFGGSDVDKVAEFYHKFGVEDRVYYDYKIDDLPFWFKALKKLKR
jgi:hypothetical protein